MQRHTTEPEPESLPDGWERVESAGPYHKYVTRDAIETRNFDGSLRYRRDVVVIVTADGAGVTKGPCYRNQWDVDDPDAAGRRLAHVLQAWIDEGGDPYGNGDLRARLESAALNGGDD
ncbi:hypothetical protein ACFQGT_00040 [Natrialbaceae archaeon GCM10025810]